MIDDRWKALMLWCEQNPYSTIEKLEIANGAPNLVVIRQQLSKTAIASIKIKYNPRIKLFTKG